MSMLELSNGEVTGVVDPGRGADVLSLLDHRTGIDVLFRTPWRDRAEAIRAGRPVSTFDPVANWLEQYRGGWQTLCPSAGQPRTVHGAPVAFHGEASVVPWTVDRSSAEDAELHTELFLVPVRIDRTIRLRDRCFSIADRLTNLSDMQLEFDYSSHPALGGPFLDGDCVLETGARRFTSDPESFNTCFTPNTQNAWPMVEGKHGEPVDLRLVPPQGSAREVFGWLEDFESHWASVTNHDLGLTVRVEWDGRHLPYAWLWQELNATAGFPWYGRARAMAVEPASMQTSGPHRRSVLRLGAEHSIDIWVNIRFEGGVT